MTAVHPEPAGTLREQIRAALDTVQDPEIGRPLTELGMLKAFDVAPDGSVIVTLLLTVAGCPMKGRLRQDTVAALGSVPGVRTVHVELEVMNDEQRAGLRRKLRGDRPEPGIPFARSDSPTTVYCIASGKGGVGKSTVTVNLAAALAARGLRVGLLDADIHGHSIPRMLGVTGGPVQVDNLLIPPIAHGMKVISIGMFVERDSPVIWRGPMLHRALNQFLGDVHWGDLDVLLLDLPPGTGDVAISLAQLVPNARILVVTTPQLAAAEVAQRAGAIAAQTGQRVVGVLENMSWWEMPDGARHEVFGAGGGKQVAEALGNCLGTAVPLLGQVPLDPRLRQAGDRGLPLVLADPAVPAAEVLIAVADRLATTSARPAGCSLGIPRLRTSAPDLSREKAESGPSAGASHIPGALSGRGAAG